MLKCRIPIGVDERDEANLSSPGREQCCGNITDSSNPVQDHALQAEQTMVVTVKDELRKFSKAR